MSSAAYGLFRFCPACNDAAQMLHDTLDECRARETRKVAAMKEAIEAFRPLLQRGFCTCDNPAVTTPCKYCPARDALDGLMEWSSEAERTHA